MPEELILSEVEGWVPVRAAGSTEPARMLRLRSA